MKEQKLTSNVVLQVNYHSFIPVFSLQLKDKIILERKKERQKEIRKERKQKNTLRRIGRGRRRNMFLVSQL